MVPNLCKHTQSFRPRRARAHVKSGSVNLWASVCSCIIKHPKSLKIIRHICIFYWNLPTTINSSELVTAIPRYFPPSLTAKALYPIFFGVVIVIIGYLTICCAVVHSATCFTTTRLIARAQFSFIRSHIHVSSIPTPHSHSRWSRFVAADDDDDV